MTLDDLAAPLGQGRKRRPRRIKIRVAQFITGALALFLSVFVIWAVVGDDPSGGEPRAIVPAHPQIAVRAPVAPPQTADVTGAIQNGQPAAATPPRQPASAANTMTVTIIDGKTGAKQEVTVPSRGAAAATPATATASTGPGLDQKLFETTAYGLIPKIAADGTRPADAFAQPAHPLAGKPNAPRIAIIVGGMGANRAVTADALGKLPAAVTLGFAPNGNDAAALAAKARAGGHELLLQVPMEGADDSDLNSDPQTLLTSLAPEQNIDRLYRTMARLQGYVGIINAQGARFTAAEGALAPILSETGKRGLVYVDDGSSPASIAGRLAAADSVPFARAEVIIDPAAAAGDIDRALGRLEAAARAHGVATLFASARPAAIDRIAQWAKTAADRGFLLVPISGAVSVKPSGPDPALRMTQDK
jgi:polysaccharide deacetylase 2 family uncharacterized protein YibQ